jgi:hypothetical protein
MPSRSVWPSPRGSRCRCEACRWRDWFRPATCEFISEPQAYPTTRRNMSPPHRGPQPRPGLRRCAGGESVSGLVKSRTHCVRACRSGDLRLHHDYRGPSGRQDLDNGHDYPAQHYFAGSTVANCVGSPSPRRFWNGTLSITPRIISENLNPRFSNRLTTPSIAGLS